MENLIKSLRRGWRNWKQHRRIKAALKYNSALSGAVTHALSGKLIVSLTSFPPRYCNLHLVVKSLLTQNISVNVVLYVDEGVKQLLPKKLISMEGANFRIAETSPLHSYRKIIPTLRDYPDSYIITVDDDVIYPSDLVETLLSGVDEHRCICFRRGHRILLDDCGNLLPYLSWSQDVQDLDARTPSHDLVPTGVGGVLYPPNSLDPLVINMDMAMKLAPKSDDLWLYWMARKAGTLHKKVGGTTDLLHTVNSQRVGLWGKNKKGGNDEALSNLLGELGMPSGFAKPHGERVAVGPS